MLADVNFSNIEIATFGGGCFWCTEAVFQRLKGVNLVESGYSGGAKENPSYEEVCNGNTGYVEVIHIKYDPAQISFKTLLEVFFETHDPTTPDRQGNDVGEQYQSIIFYHNQTQKEEAEEYIKELTQIKKYSSPIVTKVEPFKVFYKAENYHQNYFNSHPNNAYCSIVISPKIKKLTEKFGKLLTNA